MSPDVEPVTASRRSILQGAAVAALGGMMVPEHSAAAATPEAHDKIATNGRLNQSLVHWCYGKYWNVEELCQLAVRMGVPSIELIDPEHWPTLKRHGLVCALAGSHGFVQGMNNPKFQPMCLEKLRTAIDRCADAGFPSVITFTGFAADVSSPEGERSPTIDPEEGIRNCVDGYKRIVGYAEEKQINISLEMLNSRVDEEMKGHPGYQGDHVDYCLEIIRRVGSPRLGLLFDIYHVQIMDGDLIQRIRAHHEYINHVHTAGNPGRAELDGNQEINYPPVLKALLEVGYQGYVAQEFIPRGDPLAGLTEAVRLCDV